MLPTVMVLNGPSSAGKTHLARMLQTILADPWLCLGVDALILAAPNPLLNDPEGLVFGPGGEVVPGPRFVRVEDAWMEGLAAMARAGANLILDEVFLSGAAGQARWRKVLAGLEVAWVGVRCDLEVAELREMARGDRGIGMARSQAAVVHDGVRYDVEVDTTRDDVIACAVRVADALGLARREIAVPTAGG